MTKKRGFFTGVCLIIFIMLTYFVVIGQGDPDTIETGFDNIIREWFYSIRTPWLTEVVKAITFMGNTETIVVICLLILLVPLVRGKSGLDISKKIGLPIVAVAIVGSVINKIMKHVILRPRPDVSMHLIEQGGWSFPSGHSISSLLLYGLLAWLILYYTNRKASVDTEDEVFANGSLDKPHVFANKSIVWRKMFANIAVVILTLLWISIGLSRIYLGVHYPTDVLGGWTLGMVIMMIAITVVEKMENRGRKL